MSAHVETKLSGEDRALPDPSKRVESVADAMRKWSNWYGVAQPTDDDHEDIGDRATTVVKPVAGMSEEIVAYYERSSVRSEQYRSLRTRLMTGNARQQHRVIGITSAVPREGKSVTAANLAFSIAEIPHFKTLIVDGDFRQARLAKLLNIDATVGLADVLRGCTTLERVIKPTPLPNLFFMPAGRTRGNSATELLSRQTARAAFARFQRDYHYTIVDTPPATTVADVGIIGQMTFGVIFVVRMHRTSEPMARHAIKHILNNNVRILGGLLIGEDDPSSGYGRQYNDAYYNDEGR